MQNVFRGEKANSLVFANISEILPAAHQPRTVFKDKQLRELAESIRRDGILQPLLVTREADHYRLIAGERRLRAAKLAGLCEVPCVLTRKTAGEAARLSLIENIQRENLNFFEEAAAYRRLIEEFHLTEAQIASSVSKDPSTIANKLRLLKLPISAQILINKYHLTERHARALLPLLGTEKLMEVLESVAEEELNVRDTERYVASCLSPKEKPHRKSVRKGTIKDVRLCINTLNHTVSTLKRAGIKPETEIREEARFVEYIIRIPKTS